ESDIPIYCRSSCDDVEGLRFSIRNIKFAVRLGARKVLAQMSSCNSVVGEISLGELGIRHLLKIGFALAGSDLAVCLALKGLAIISAMSAFRGKADIRGSTQTHTFSEAAEC